MEQSTDISQNEMKDGWWKGKIVSGSVSDEVEMSKTTSSDTYVGDIDLSSNQEWLDFVIEFKKRRYRRIQGNFYVSGENGAKILLLLGSQLEEIDGNFFLDNLMNLDGLHNLRKITGMLHVLKICSFEGLSNLKSIGGDFVVFQCSLFSFVGLDRLTTIGGGFRIIGHFCNRGGS